jgi:thioredoxin-like negative regulator of GroEL
MSEPKKSDKSLLWIGGGIALLMGLLYLLTDVPMDIFKGGASRPVPGKVYELTSDNLAVARRHSAVLVALYTTTGNAAGSRMSRSLKAFADRVKDRAIVALGNLDEEPELAKKAGVDHLPVWVVYRNGIEVSRATGDNSDLSVDRLLSAQTTSSR